MKKLNNNFGKNKLLDKKANILSEEDMAKRSEIKGKIAKVSPKDMERVKRMALTRDLTLDKMMISLYETYKEDLKTGAYDPPVLPIRLPPNKNDNPRKSLRIPVDFYEDMVEYRKKTGTSAIYHISDYIEYYYYNHFHAGRQTPAKMRPYKLAENQVDDIIQQRINRQKEGW